jgi:EpsI family protein
VAQQGSRIEPITYWVLVGETVALSGVDQKFAQLRYSTRGTIPDGMLVRVSSIDPNPAHAYSTQAEFINSLLAAMPAASRIRVAGAAST